MNVNSTADSASSADTTQTFSYNGTTLLVYPNGTLLNLTDLTLLPVLGGLGSGGIFPFGGFGGFGRSFLYSMYNRFEYALDYMLRNNWNQVVEYL